MTAAPEDLRPAIEQTAAAAEFRGVKSGLRAAPVALGFAAVMVAIVVAERKPVGFVFPGLLGGLGVLGVAAAIVVRRRAVPVLATVRSATGPATQIRSPRGRLAVAMLLFVVFASFPLPLGVVAVQDEKAPLGVALLVVGALLLLPALMALAGRYVAGSLVLDRATLRYRAFGLESTIRWADLAVVEWADPDRRTTLRVRDDARVAHRYRSWPLRGQRADGPTSAVLGLRGWGLLASDVARLVMVVAADPAARAELGTPAAIVRARQVVGRPVTRLSGRWAVGEPLPSDHPASTSPAVEGDEGTVPVDVPLWNEPATAVVFRKVAGFYRWRLLFGAGVLSFGAALAALPLLAFEPTVGLAYLGVAVAVACQVLAALDWSTPPPPAPAAPPAGADQPPELYDGVVLARSGTRLRLRVASAVSLGVGILGVAGVLWLHFGAGWAVLAVVAALPLLATPGLVARGIVAPNAITLTSSGVSCRTGLRRWSVPWSAVLSARLAWNEVVYLHLRPEEADRVGLDDDGLPGRPSGRLLDAAGTAVSGAALARALDHYARHGGPRGETRDVGAVAARLGLHDVAG